MNLIEQSAEMMTEIPKDLLQQIELRGRVCYKSEDRITTQSAEKFVQNLILRGHESVLEHFGFTVRFITDRGITHEIVRHRIGSYSQESTRYCNYGDGHVTMIPPNIIGLDAKAKKARAAWVTAAKAAEKAYNEMLKCGVAPQIARSVLPTALKTEIIVTYNLREWRHFFRLRCAPTAHPMIQELAGSVLIHLRKLQPVLFGDVGQLNHLTHLARLKTFEGKELVWDLKKD